MPQLQRISRNNTTVLRHSDVLIVTLHQTQIVSVTAARILLNTGGWFTSTTKTRMNQVSNQEGLGYRVKKINGKWFTKYRGLAYEFVGNVCQFER